MSAYNKLIAAVLSVLATRWFMRVSGVDLDAAGVGEDLRLAIMLSLDACAAAVSGFFVWLIPNVKKTVCEPDYEDGGPR